VVLSQFVVPEGKLPEGKRPWAAIRCFPSRVSEQGAAEGDMCEPFLMALCDTPAPLMRCVHKPAVNETTQIEGSTSISRLISCV
jgi:hypothetical protein